MVFLFLDTTSLSTLSVGEKDHLAIPVISCQSPHLPNLPLGVHHYNFLTWPPPHQSLVQPLSLLC